MPATGQGCGLRVAQRQLLAKATIVRMNNCALERLNCQEAAYQEAAAKSAVYQEPRRWFPWEPRGTSDEGRGKRLAEREGFEPPVRLPVRRISSAVLSTTQPPLRGGGRVNASRRYVNKPG
jgi:hypothetical protein